MKQSAGFVICAVLASPALAADAPPEPSAAPWSDVLIELGKSVCVTDFKAPDGVVYRNEAFGSRKECGSVKAETPLARAADKAVDDAWLALATIRFDDVGAEVPKSMPVDEATRIFRSACLASPLFLRPILAFLPKALADNGLRCEGCPPLTEVPSRHVSWEEFGPYLGAYFWPDPVKTPLGPDGKPFGKPQYTYHKCIGINGISELKSPDRLLTRAAFVVAQGSQEAGDLGFAHFRRILASAEFLAAESDEARTAYLRRHLPLAVAGDPEEKKAACAALSRFSTALGLVLDGCGETATASPPRSQT
jgi:hypothetical protein